MDESTKGSCSAGSCGPCGSSSWPLLLLLLAAGAAMFMLQARRPQTDGGEQSLLGQGLPPLEASGWLNAEPPLAEGDLRGQVVLVDYWASWCGPCRAAMPGVVELHNKYRGEGLVVVGFTPEGAEEREVFETYVNGVEGMDWPIAYGAGMAIDAMGITRLPTLVLYDRTGKSVWSGHSHDGLEEAVVAALAKK